MANILADVWLSAAMTGSVNALWAFEVESILARVPALGRVARPEHYVKAVRRSELDSFRIAGLSATPRDHGVGSDRLVHGGMDTETLTTFTHWRVRFRLAYEGWLDVGGTVTATLVAEQPYESAGVLSTTQIAGVDLAYTGYAAGAGGASMEVVSPEVVMTFDLPSEITDADPENRSLSATLVVRIAGRPVAVASRRITLHFRTSILTPTEKQRDVRRKAVSAGSEAWAARARWGEMFGAGDGEGDSDIHIEMPDTDDLLWNRKADSSPFAGYSPGRGLPPALQNWLRRFKPEIDLPDVPLPDPPPD